MISSTPQISRSIGCLIIVLGLFVTCSLIVDRAPSDTETRPVQQTTDMLVGIPSTTEFSTADRNHIVAIGTWTSRGIVPSDISLSYSADGVNFETFGEIGVGVMTDSYHLPYAHLAGRDKVVVKVESNNNEYDLKKLKLVFYTEFPTFHESRPAPVTKEMNK